MTPVDCVLAFGSNLGDRSTTIREAVAEVASLPGVELLAASRLYETAAVKLHGVDVEAPGYLNSCAIVRTTLDPHALLARLAAVELAHGRVRAERWGDRTLDVDIVTYGDARIDDDTLTVPHPRAAERDFVLAPWLELDPDASVPGLGSVRGLLARTGNTAVPVAASVEEPRETH